MVVSARAGSQRGGTVGLGASAYTLEPQRSHKGPRQDDRVWTLLSVSKREERKGEESEANRWELVYIPTETRLTSAVREPSRE